MDKLRTLRNIEKEHKTNRLVVITVVVFSFLFCIIIGLRSINYAEKSTNKVYVIENGKSLLMAVKGNVEDNRPAEIKDHIKTLLNLLFTIAPDRAQIEENQKAAAFLGDSSIVNFINNLQEAKYYSQMIAASASSKLNFDSSTFDINYSVYPYIAEVTVKNIIVRPTNSEVRTLEVKMRLRNVPRSDNNSHGLIVENFDPRTLDSLTYERNQHR
jgi:conjugative transposon TraK protein